MGSVSDGIELNLRYERIVRIFHEIPQHDMSFLLQGTGPYL